MSVVPDQVVRDQLEAISTIRQAVRSKLRLGPRTIAENLFDLLENAVRKHAEAASGVFLSSPRDRDTLADLVKTTKGDKDFKDTLKIVANALALCRPDDPSLMPPSENRLGVASILAFIDDVPHLVIVRGPTSKIRNPDAEEDHLLRFEAEFRPLSLAMGDAALQHPAVLSLRHNATRRSFWRPRLFTRRALRLLISVAILGAIASISVILVMRQRHEAAEATQRNRTEAKRLLDEAVDALGGHPGTRSVHMEPGVDSAMLDRYEVARRKLEQATTLDPMNSQIANAMGIYYMATGHDDKATIEFERALLYDQTNGSALCNLGDIRCRASDPGGALKYYERAASIGPTDDKPHIGMASAYLQYYMFRPRTRRMDTRVFNPSPAGDLEFDAVPDVQDKIVANQLDDDRGDLAKAAAAARRAIQLAPLQASSYRILGNILDVRGDRSGATEAYLNALHLAPDDPHTHYDYAIALGNERQYDAAISQFVRAVELNPNYADAFWALAFTLHHQAKDDLALAALLQCNRIRPNVPQATSEIGQLTQKRPDLVNSVEARAHAFADDYGKFLLHELSATDAH